MQAFNPYLPSWEYIPDGEPHVFGDRVYVYGSHDHFNAPIFCVGDYVCWSAPVKNLKDWRYEGVIFRKNQDPQNKRGIRLLFAPDDVDGFASAIQRLHEDEPLRKQLGDAAYHSVEKFDVRNSVFVMEQIYRTYLDIPGSPMADPSGAKRDTYAVKG